MIDKLHVSLPVTNSHGNLTGDQANVVITKPWQALRISRDGEDGPAIDIELTETGFIVIQHPSLGRDEIVLLRFDRNHTHIESNFTRGPLSFDDIDLTHPYE